MASTERIPEPSLSDWDGEIREYDENPNKNDLETDRLLYDYVVPEEAKIRKLLSDLYFSTQMNGDQAIDFKRFSTLD